MDRLRTNIVFGDQRFTVTVVQSLEFRTGSWNHKRFLTGSLASIAVIVREPGRSYALDMDGQPGDIDSSILGAM
ncbi:MAG: hypothetical protein KJO01_08710 [Gammaproteobacteria bacterium]|nr:hypothetical protein [Gammaproteobacteria bacterium]MBT8110587.1 hypothetical protein [Gammaproteobacteria bacterium]NNL45287.1 hypothetical protein [Woeseiaceae bacterium]